ncbi:MAG TPA: hypothetical protein VMM79_07265 [Longimicrobiales bacterium]|nr:hypothetical protein [Longimicrobiales bacterium]
MSRRLTLFTSAGATLATAGGSGSGPGEFQSLDRIALHGDSIVAFDARRRSFAVFTHDLVLGRHESLPAADSRYSAIALMPSGDVLGAVYIAPSMHGQNGPEVWREPLRLAAMDTRGRITQTFLEYQDVARVSDMRDGFSVLPFPFAEEPGVHLAGDMLVVASGDSSTFIISTSDGSTRSVALPG